MPLKPGFHSNARNSLKALRKEKYASKIKSVQQTQENYASKKTKVRKRKSRNWRKWSLRKKTQR